MSKARGPYRVDPLGYKKKAPALLNSLTEDETNATASVVGLVGKPAQQEPVAWIDEYGNAFPLAAKQYSIVGKHWKPLYTSPPASKHNNGVIAERQRIVNLLMIQHEAAKGAHNYWHVAAQLIQADVASDT